MKRKIILGVILCMVLLLAGCGYDSQKRYEAKGTVQDAYTRWVGIAGKGGHVTHCTVIEFEGVTYKISGSSTYCWAKPRIGTTVNLNVDEYIKDGAVISRDISLDYYK